jgi:phytoene dehydrogenase-like protein
MFRWPGSGERLKGGDLMEHWDAIIIGAGMGGLCAAARLTAGGKRVLVLEKSGHLGGRCSHQAKSGGGLRGLIDFACNGDNESATRLFDAFVAAMKSVPPDTITFKAWLHERTDNPDVHDLFQGFCAALIGTGMHEIPAGEFFRFLRYSSRGSRFGMAPEGNGANMEALAEAIEARGSKILRHTNCRRIVLENGRAAGVGAKTAGQPETIFAGDIVISNTGPARTVELAGGREYFDAAYLERLDAAPNEAPIFHISFVSDAPLIEGFDGCMVFGNTRNLIYLEIPSLISPRVTPPGQFLHTAFGAPTDAAHADLKLELKNTLAELAANFPGQLDGARFLVNARHSGQSPGMHRWAGHMMPVTTPIRNLYNVGDGCTPPGTIGTEGAAGSAREVAQRILG